MGKVSVVHARLIPGSGVRDKQWRHIADPGSSQHFNYDRVVALLSGDHVDEVG